MTDTTMLPVSRRTLLQGAGAVVVAFGMPAELLAATAKDARPALVPEELDSYIAGLILLSLALIACAASDLLIRSSVTTDPRMS